MRFDLSNFAPAPITLQQVQHAIEHHEQSLRPRMEMLWAYYRNPISGLVSSRSADASTHTSRRYRLGQERGLPARLLGAAGRAWGHTLPDDRTNPWSRKEIVIENDIAWRIHTMVDFLLGKPVVLTSTARDPATRRRIERILDTVWEAAGGIALMQDLALIGHVFGHVDLLVRAAEATPTHESTGNEANANTNHSDDRTLRLAAQAVRIEIIEPTRGVALTNPADYRRLDAYILRYRRAGAPTPKPASTSTSSRVANSRPNDLGIPADSVSPLWRRLLNIGQYTSTRSDPGASHDQPATLVTEIITGNWHQVYKQDANAAATAAPQLVHERASLVEANRDSALGPPVVHIQNLSQPFAFAGLSEVEPLVPLQDELNTRLSDRASRVTLQSFKMLLAKGLGETTPLTVAPGVVWQTDNPEAQIESFGGDAASPSEDRHIDEIREALDKASGVPPLAAGVVRAKIGNLSSENALRVTLMGLLSKTARKRIAYGKGIADASRLILEALGRLGIFRTAPEDRTVRVEWPDPLPRDERESLDAALRKLELGVPRERILAELGYPTPDPASAGIE